MNVPLNELRQKMIQETEQFLGRSLQHDSQAPEEMTEASSLPVPQPGPSDDRPYFSLVWLEWIPVSQVSAP